MTRTSIALSTRMTETDERAWLDALHAALPQENIRPVRDIPPNHRSGIEIAIVANPDPAELLTLPDLKLIHSLWAGVERLVRDLAGQAVPIARLVDPELARTMAESVLAWTLYLFRDMPAYQRQQARKKWAPIPYRRPQDVRVSVLGLGNLGQAAATRLHASGFQVTGWSRTQKDIPGVTCLAGENELQRTLASTDILVCLLPLTPETHGLLSDTQLRTMPHGASIINFGRGPSLDVVALMKALDDRHLGHAVLDVFDCEPLPADSPLWIHPHVTVLPHVSAPTDMRTATQIVAGNLKAFRANGTMPEIVDIARGY
ncbi:2-hydroxyacid dehydrogenase [Roseovarius pelagicus]|uniref:Glyoxylate/hydroxypyruvate reductase A n=1 Tax=Roseovarius pelagicus TaxID=2980108 RepID=A0ABY6D9E6_9RHOB|nr:glyoxylate/hydroxypyruvate reductase A [Roseovarius pelagicus]UXX82769.1 glyoxylate/hydroxypyruvate reductase A [Roseovarius pelagicus]